MAGGTFLTQNKVLPGVYVNVLSKGKTVGEMAPRGTVTMPVIADFGPVKQVIKLESGDSINEILGFALASNEALIINEALKRAKTLLVYRINGGTAASVTLGTLNVTALYPGAGGNNIAVSIAADIENEGKFKVSTYLNDVVQDVQSVEAIADLKPNEFVKFSGGGNLSVGTKTSLKNGTTAAAINQDFSDYLSAVEGYDFDVIALPYPDMVTTFSDESLNSVNLKSVFAAYVKRMREDEGKKIQVVLENYPTADYEGIISVKNGVILSDGTKIPSFVAVAWVAGAVAAANVNQSLTYTAYDDAVDVDAYYKQSEIESALKNGEFLFIKSDGRAIVQQDINTFVSYEPNKPYIFSKNRVIRVLDAIANDMKRIFEKSYIGKVSNNYEGRVMFKNEVVAYMEDLQNINAITNFDSRTDIAVEMGNEADVVTVSLNVQPVDSIEKIYMTVTVA